MANKLYFKYGTVNSSKSANLLMIRHNYIEQGFTVYCAKPSIDTRDGVGVIATRADLASVECDAIDEDSAIYLRSKAESGDVFVNQNDIIIEDEYDVVMIDEAQFLTPSQVEDLWIISKSKPVLCFGLLTDYLQTMFDGSKRLMELAESVEKIKTVCECGCAANYTIRVDGKYRITNGPQIEIGGNDRYKAVCKSCLLKYPVK